MGFVNTDYQVYINGQDVTSRFNPYLKSLEIERASGETSDGCSLVLGDPDGAIVLPSERARVLVRINRSQAFDGFVSDVDYSFTKSGGRELSLDASSVDQGSKIKEPQLQQKDEATFADVAREWGEKIGLTVTVTGDIASISRPYWLRQNESFLAWGQRISKEIGASFKVLGNRAFFVGLNEGLSATGRTLTPIDAVYGQNLIGGNISPIVSRPKFKDVEIRYFDLTTGEYKTVNAETGISDVDAALRTVITASSEEQAKDKAKAEGKLSDREKGSGTITILGDELAEPEAICNVRGVRPGIDGGYRISSIKLTLAKGAGFTTQITVKQPQDGAGIDNR